MSAAPLKDENEFTEELETAILKEILDGNSDRFSLLLSRYNQSIYRVIKSINRNENEIEDIMQEAYLLCFHNLHTFKGESKFSTWLTRIAINCTLQHIKQKRTIMKKLAKIVENRNMIGFSFTTSSHNPELQFITNENKTQIEQIIDSLPDKYRQVFILSVVERLSYEEIATFMDIEATNIRMRVSRAKEMLRKKIAENAQYELLYTIGGDRCARITSSTLSKL